MNEKDNVQRIEAGNDEWMFQSEKGIMFFIHDQQHLKYHQDMQKIGYKYAVLTEGKWVSV